MKYLKTYEKIKDFYKSDDKTLIVTSDEKWAVLKVEDFNKLLLFDTSVLEDHLDMFLLSEVRAKDLIKYYTGMLDQFGYMDETDMVYKIHSESDAINLLKGSQRHIDHNQNISLNVRDMFQRKQTLVRDGIIERVDEIDLKTMNFMIGAQKEKIFFDL